MTISALVSTVGALLVIAAVLGAAVAVYRTNLQGTALTNARATITDLRGEIDDYQRRALEQDAEVKLLQSDRNSLLGRVKLLEDLVTKRADDEQIRADIRVLGDKLDRVLSKT